MAERSIAGGSGRRLRRSYLQVLLVAGVFLGFVLLVPLNMAFRSTRGTLGVAVTGAVVTVVAFGLLGAAVLLGRAAVIGDVVSLPMMRRSGQVAIAAQVAGFAGFLTVAVVGLLRRQDGDLVVATAVLLGSCSLAPAVFGATVQRLSIRLTAGQPPP